MIGGEIDLSAGMVFALAPFVMHFAADAGVPVVPAVLLGVAAAGCVGLVNGVVTRVARRAVLRHDARHAVPGQRLHLDDLARHAGDAARQRGLRTT